MAASLWTALDPLGHLLQFLLWALDFTVWLVSIVGPCQFFAAAVRSRLGWGGGALSSFECDAATKSRRGLSAVEADFDWRDPQWRCATMHEVWAKAVAQHGPVRCAGTRDFLGVHTPAFARGQASWGQAGQRGRGAGQPLNVFGDVGWKTYSEVGEAAASFGKGLHALGLQPLSLAKSRAVTDGFGRLVGPHALLIFEDTCEEWSTAMLGALGQGLVVATSYSTLGVASVAEMVQELGIAVLLCNYAAVPAMVALLEVCPTLRHVVYTRHKVDHGAPSISESIGYPASSKYYPGRLANASVVSFDEVVLAGRESALEASAHLPTEEHLALVMYTSGTTGKPKGVMLKHSALVAAVKALRHYLQEAGCNRDPKQQEVYLAYLPAAHILEFVLQVAMLTLGAAVGFSDPLSISPRGGLTKRAQDGALIHQGGLQVFRPTVLVGVPKVWDLLKRGVEAQLVHQAGPLARAVFKACLAVRSRALQLGRSSPVASLAFGDAYEVLGGRVKLCLCGGGPLAPQVQNFIRVAFGVNLVQSYGLTETAGVGTAQPPKDVQVRGKKGHHRTPHTHTLPSQRRG
mmetsp:Transcript_3866/g.9149  ORF Transcript_3866/g.9149 Transcript_3866/m.9149 type:complete len:574 (+) Transcript_3866:140-1861(+)